MQLSAFLWSPNAAKHILQSAASGSFSWQKNYRGKFISVQRFPPGFILKGPLTRPHWKFGLYTGSCTAPSKERLAIRFFLIASLLETGEIELSHEFHSLLNPLCYSLSFYSPTASLLRTAVEVSGDCARQLHRGKQKFPFIPLHLITSINNQLVLLLILLTAKKQASLPT